MVATALPNSKIGDRAGQHGDGPEADSKDDDTKRSRQRDYGGLNNITVIEGADSNSAIARANSAVDNKDRRLDRVI